MVEVLLGDSPALEQFLHAQTVLFGRLILRLGSLQIHAGISRIIWIKRKQDFAPGDLIAHLGADAHDACAKRGHQIDLFEWCLGPIVEVSAFGSRLSEFEVEEGVEDIATVLYRFASGALASAHYNHFRRDRRGVFELVGSEGSIIWDYLASTASLYRAQSRTWEHRAVICERDDFYVAQARHFIAACRGEGPPLVPGEAGKRSLLVALACYQSMAEGRAVLIGEMGA